MSWLCQIQESRLPCFSLGFQSAVPSAAVSLVKELKPVLILRKLCVRGFTPPAGSHKSVQSLNHVEIEPSEVKGLKLWTPHFSSAWKSAFTVACCGISYLHLQC